jgi:hypothetical protein
MAIQFLLDTGYIEDLGAKWSWPSDNEFTATLEASLITVEQHFKTFGIDKSSAANIQDDAYSMAFDAAADLACGSCSQSLPLSVAGALITSIAPNVVVMFGSRFYDSLDR